MKPESTLRITIANFNDTENICLFSEESSLRQHQIIKLNNADDKVLPATLSYEYFCELLKEGPGIAVHALRIELACPVDNNQLIKLNRKLTTGETQSFTMPLISWLCTNQYHTEIICIPLVDVPLILDGFTSIEFINTPRTMVVNIQLYYSLCEWTNIMEIDKRAISDNQFNRLLTSDIFFYDYLHIYNHSNKREVFSLFFTKDGILINADKETVQAVSNKLCYQKGDKVNVFAITGKMQVITEALLIGGEVEDFEAVGKISKNLRYPLLHPGQIPSNIISRIDTDPKEVINEETAVYSYRLNPKEEVCFFIHRNKTGEMPNNILKQTIIYINPAIPLPSDSVSVKE